MRVLKVENVKKRQKLIFYADRIIKLYENGALGYFKQKNEKLKALIQPCEINSLVQESGSKIKLVTKAKTYNFKFATSGSAKEWYQALH